MIAKDALLYEERLSANRTEALFASLALLFLSLWVRRARSGRRDRLAAVFAGLGGFFLFYAVNYRALHIRLTADALRFRFGLFAWTVPLDNVESCRLDDGLLAWQRWGGAGIHFMSVRGRYRASVNFLEHPRVVIAFKEKVGPVRDLSFSTGRPDEVIRLVRAAIAARGAA